MQDRAPKYVRGDALTADRLNKTVQQANRAANAAHGAGIGGFASSDLDMRIGVPIVRLAMLRIKCDTLPEVYADAPALDNSYQNQCNAVVQTWDDEYSQWADVDGREVYVHTKDNLPLLENMLVYAVFNTATRRWVPAFQDRVAHVRIPPGAVPDGNGFYPGYLETWDNDNLQWVTVREVWVRDSNT